MKLIIKQLFAVAFLLSSTLSFGQAPQKFNYQGIARDTKGNAISKQQMSLKISVLATQDATVSEYEETQLVTTNEFGLYTLQIGNGTPITGEMKTVKWETGNKYIKVAIDTKGGADYVDMGTSQLLSVPYAIYADKAGLARETVAGNDKTRTGTVSSNAAHVVGDVNYVTKFIALNTIGKSLIYDNGTAIGIGTTSPSASARVHVLSATGTQPMIFESPLGVHCLFREGGVNRGYFGSYIGSGGAYPTPTGTSNDDFDIGTSGASVGKLHLATNTTPRLTITPNTGLVGIGTTSPTARLEVLGGAWDLATQQGDVKIGNATNNIKIGIPTAGTGAGHATIAATTMLSLGSGSTYPNLRTLNVGSGKVGVGTITPARSMHLNLANSGYDAYKITNPTTGTSSVNGFEMGLSGLNGYLWNWSNGLIYFGTNNQFRMTILGNGHVGIGTTTPTNTFHVVSSDTAGLFQSSNASAGSAIQGIVRSEFTGSAESKDHIGVYGKVTNTNPGWGIGVRGEGNYHGVQGIGLSTATGVYGSSSSGNGIYGYSNTGTAVYGYSGGSYALYGNATGQNSKGLFALGDSIGSHNEGHYFGSYNVGNNTNSNTTASYSYGSYNSSTSTTARSYGVYTSAVGGNASWNTYGIYSTVSGTAALQYAGYFNGTLYATTLTGGTKPFTIDHPLDPANKVLRHSSIESNDMMNLYNGNITTDANGFATVTMPDYFDALNENFKYQLTVIGTFAQAIVKNKMSNNQFVIQTNQPNVEVSWQVAGVRHDAVAKKYPIVVEEAKTGENVGHYYEPIAYGVSEKLGIGYSEKVKQNDANNEHKKIEEERKRIEKMHK